MIIAGILAGCTQASGPAPSASIADVQAAEVVAPAGNVRPAMRVFSGVWLGKWDGTWDAAVIVKQIHPDGVADVEYRWVDHVGMPYSTSATRTGRIDDGVLHVGNVQLVVDPNDPTTARGDLLHAANDATG